MNKIDFAIIISANFCNPNGDPLNGNRPRTDYDGYGFMTDVCLKRKIRNRLQDLGQNILNVQNNRVLDGLYSVKSRVESQEELNKYQKEKNIEQFKKEACKLWFDVRAFGQVFAFKSDFGVSIPIRGPVSIGNAVSLNTVDIIDVSITKSINANTPENGNDNEKDSSTMVPSKCAIRKGCYVAYGSIFPQLANLTGFSEKDAEALKEAMSTIFENDASAARPSGSMSSTLYWWEHVSSKGSNTNSAIVHKSLNIKPSDDFPYFQCSPKEIDGVKLTIF